MGSRAAAAHDLDAKYREESGEFFFTGVQALVRVPLDQMRADRKAGHRTATFVSGYQGSPLGGYDRELISHKKLLDEWNIVHKPGLNEELGATAVMGSQLASTFPKQRFDGVLGVWYGKAPGLDRAGDAIRHAAYAGTHGLGGVLTLTGDDPSNKSSTLPSASEYALADLHQAILHPGNVQEVLDLGMHGVALSRATGLWSAIKIVTSVADGSATAEVGPDRIHPVIPTFEWNGKPYVPKVNPRLGGPPANAAEQEIYEARYELAKLYAVANDLNRITINPPDAWLGIVASGRLYHEVLAAAAILGLDEDGLRRNGIRLLQLQMMHPFEGSVARRFADGLTEIMVVEEKRPFIEMHLRDALYGMPDAPRVVGKHDPERNKLVPTHGALDADYLVEPLRRRLTQRIDADRLTPPKPKVKKKLDLLLPTRTPYFCSGCPHSTGTKVPEGELVGSGIGCHGLVTLMDPDRVGTLMGNTQMGGEGVQWIGIEPFVDVPHFTQNLGDGTFAHSGSLAVRAAVAAGSNVTFKILYNGAVAMTGGQDAAGAMPVPQLTQWLLAEGVAKVIVTTDEVDKYKGIRLADGVELWDRDKIIEAQEELGKVKGTTVLIHDQQCAAEKRRDRKRGIMVEPPERVVINERVCEGCGDCGVQSNCLSVQPIETEFGRKTQIHQSSCNKDYSCLAGDCPSFLTVVPKKKSGGKTSGDKTNKAQGGARRKPAIDVATLPKPTLLVPAEDTTIRMPGVGGTGVVTVSQILGTAATLDGRYVGGLDQTGLSQKAGPVVSDLRITTTPVEGTNKLTAGSADVYLVFDLLVGLSPQNLEGVSAERTVAVVSTAKTPTGFMIRDPQKAFPDMAPLQAALDASTRAEHNRYVDTIAVTEGLFGESTTANTFQIGVAYQLGVLPISAEAIEQAIELNGAAVEANKLAFRWGRKWVLDPEAVRAASVLPEDALAKPSASLEAAIVAAGLGEGELGRVVRLRAADLVGYQDERYAKKYLETVAKAARTGQSEFAISVAKYLYKLMAYKDEYEVARLHIEEAAKLNIQNAVGDDMAVSYNLHPPMLRAMGMEKKLRLGANVAEPTLKALAKGKKLRGTPADPFGYAKVRRVERQLIKEYRDVVEKLCTKVNGDNAAEAAKLAALPDMVRGYEEIKLRNVERYHTALAEARGKLGV